MPSSQVMHEWGKHNLHSGKGGPLVPRDKAGQKQALAIMYSERAKEGKSSTPRSRGRSSGR